MEMEMKDNRLKMIFKAQHIRIEKHEGETPNNISIDLDE